MSGPSSSSPPVSPACCERLLLSPPSPGQGEGDPPQGGQLCSAIRALWTADVRARLLHSHCLKKRALPSAAGVALRACQPDAHVTELLVGGAGGNKGHAGSRPRMS